MAHVQYPYLDLTVLPDIRPHVISASAAVLFDADISQVLWANGEGANYIGSPAIRHALEGQLNIDGAMLRQIKTAVERLETHGDASAIMRVRRGFKTRLINFHIKPVALPGGERSLLLVTEKLHGRRHSRTDMIEAAVNCLDGYSHASAVLDASGHVIASSEHFDSLDVSISDLSLIAHEANSEADRLVKRPVNTNSGPMPSGLARLEDSPILHLLVLANAGDNSQTIDEQVSTSNLNVEADVAQDDDTDEKASRVGAFSNKRQPLNNSDTGRWYFKPIILEDDYSDLDDEVVEAQATETPEKEQLTAIETSGLVQTSQYQTAASTPPKEVVQTAEAPIEEVTPSLENENDEVTSESAQTASASNIQTDAMSVRFIWEMDDKQTFTSVSRELSDAVGEPSADLTGRLWTDVAEAFNFENGSEISALLEKGDTWSGKTVLWPVHGTDLRVPVDLAGLPSYGRNRNFDGFNGFGIIRQADALVDPTAIDLSLDQADRNEVQIEEPEVEPEVLSDKVVDLAERRNSHTDRELSSGEQDAFREIAETLGEDAPKNPDVVSEVPLARDEFEVTREPVEEPNLELNSETTNEQARSEILTPDHNVDTSILARLPIPVLVYRDNELLFANEEFFELTEYEDLDALASSGGIDKLFGVGAQMASNQIFNANGHTLDVHAHIQRVPWDDRKAMLLTLRKGEDVHTLNTDEKTNSASDPNGNVEQLSKNASEEPIAKPNMRLVEPQPASENPTPVPVTKRPTSKTFQAFGGLNGDDLRGILDTATDGVIILSDEGVVRAINQSAEALFDQRPDDIQGQSFTKLLAPESQRAALDYLSSLSEAGVAGLLNDGREIIGRTAKGGLIPLFMTIGKLESTDACCAVVRDITAWKKAEEDLLTARAEAEKANEQKTEFLARISHEIRTPLNAIIGFSDIMIEERFGKIDNDRYRGYLRDIQKSGSHVLDLVNDLLDITKIEAGKMELAFDACNLNTTVSETVAMTQPEANKERVIIRTSLSAVVPKVVADPRSLKQIVLNLVSNSIKFTKSGGQVIVSTVYEDTGEVVLRVRDTGVGMSDTELAKAMQPFEQVNNTMSASKQGTGLGLPLTKAMVEANRAQFHIESAPEEGTLVEIHFPTQRVLADR